MGHHGVGIGWVAVHGADTAALASRLIGTSQRAVGEIDFRNHCDSRSAMRIIGLLCMRSVLLGTGLQTGAALRVGVVHLPGLPAPGATAAGRSTVIVSQLPSPVVRPRQSFVRIPVKTETGHRGASRSHPDGDAAGFTS
jgi:hypothetical protein